MVKLRVDPLFDQKSTHFLTPFRESGTRFFKNDRFFPGPEKSAKMAKKGGKITTFCHPLTSRIATKMTKKCVFLKNRHFLSKSGKKVDFHGFRKIANRKSEKIGLFFVSRVFVIFEHHFFTKKWKNKQSHCHDFRP